MLINLLSPQMEISLELGNMTRVQEFILLGLSTSPETREVLFAIFLTLYLLTLLENALIIFLVCSHTELHKPMYFFLGNLSCLEMCYVSVTMPSLLAGLWTGPCHVPLPACMTQLFFFIALICTECALLASMACDRYVAICRPLHYPLLMRPQVCLGLAGTSWLGGLLVSVVKTACIASLSYCGPNVLNHFFCDVSPAQPVVHPRGPDRAGGLPLGHRHPLGLPPGGHSLLCGHCQGCAPYAFGRRPAQGLLHLRLPPGGGGHLLLGSPLHLLSPQPHQIHGPEQGAVGHLHGGHAHVQSGHLLPAEQGGPGGPVQNSPLDLILVLGS